MIVPVARLVAALAVVLGLGGLALAQTPKPITATKPITMEELHRAGACRAAEVHAAAGDAKTGRALFASSSATSATR